MTTYTTITDLEAGKPVVTGKMTALRDNPIAITEGASGAPRIKPAAMDTAALFTGLDADKLDGQHGSYYRDPTNLTSAVAIAKGGTGSTTASGARTNLGLGALAVLNSVNSAQIDNGAIHQTELDTGLGEVSTAGAGEFTLPGGSYGFYPQTKHATPGDGAASMAADLVSASYVTNVYLNATNGGTTYSQQRYINSSPPYDMGDGVVPIFIFIKVLSSGIIESVYSADAPPWVYNGPTDTRGKLHSDGKKYQNKIRIVDRESGEFEIDKIEITQAIKNADMPLIPHPFASGKKDGETIVLLDPPATEKLLLLHESGESINTLLHEDYLRIDNEKLKRCTPSGVCAHRWKWKRTK